MCFADGGPPSGPLGGHGRGQGALRRHVPQRGPRQRRLRQRPGDQGRLPPEWPTADGSRSYLVRSGPVSSLVQGVCAVSRTSFSISPSPAAHCLLLGPLALENWI